MTVSATRRLILNPQTSKDVKILGIVFDMDGTLCKPQTWMFKSMRDALGIDKSIDILDYVHSLSEHEQAEAHIKLQDVERTAMVDMEATPGVDTLLKFIDSTHDGTSALPRAILTRNFPIPVQHLTENVLLGHSKTFWPVITREFKPPKPSPAGLLEIAKQWNVSPENLVMVGDSIDDMRAGRRAGAGTILIKTDVNDHVSNAEETDVTVSNIEDIIGLLQDGFTSKSVSKIA